MDDYKVWCINRTHCRNVLLDCTKCGIKGKTELKIGWGNLREHGKRKRNEINKKH